MDIEEGRGVTSGNGPQPGVANYDHGYPAVEGYPVSKGRQTPRGPDPLPCGGLGIGWLLFILGFFLGVFPWYIGALMLCRMKDQDKREKPGFIACAVCAVFTTIVIIVVVVIVSQNSSTSNGNY